MYISKFRDTFLINLVKSVHKTSVVPDGGISPKLPLTKGRYKEI